LLSKGALFWGGGGGRGENPDFSHKKGMVFTIAKAGATVWESSAGPPKRGGT